MLTGTCDHCGRSFPLKAMCPVIVTGAQSYNGHLVTNRPGSCSMLLCSDCYRSFGGVSIQGMTVRDDEEAVAVLAALP